MNFPKVACRMFPKIRSLSEGYTTNSVIIFIDSKSEEILQNPTTGRQTLTGRSTPVHSMLVDINLRSSSPGHIHHLLSNRLVNHRWLCGVLASKISNAATLLGFGRNIFTLTVSVEITYQTVVSAPLLLPISEEESKSLKLETESCSICLDDLIGSSSKHGGPKRTTCSHIFHDRCASEWLRRKNTCPLCRTVLYVR